MSEKNAMQRIEVDVENAFAQSAILIVEPWAYEVILEPGQRVRVVFLAPSDEPVQTGVVCGPYPDDPEGRNYIMVLGWHRSTSMVLDRQGNMLDGSDIPSL